MAKRMCSRAPRPVHPTTAPLASGYSFSACVAESDDFGALFVVALVFMASLLVMLWWAEAVERGMRRLDSAHNREPVDEHAEPDEPSDAPETRR